MPKSANSRPASSRSPFVFDLRELGRRPGSMREYRRDVPAAAAIGLELIGVLEGAPLELDLRLESVIEGVLVTGTVSAPLTGQCGRCLEPITDEVVGEICELFAYVNSATDSTTDEDEVHRVDGDIVDVEPVVHEAVVLGLPLTPLCGPDCSGLCPDCGQRLDDLPSGHTHERLDPRWAKLAAFTDGDDARGNDAGAEPGPTSTSQPHPDIL